MSQNRRGSKNNKKSKKQKPPQPILDPQVPEYNWKFDVLDTLLDLFHSMMTCVEIAILCSPQYFASVAIILEAMGTKTDTISLTLLNYEPIMNMMSPKTTAQTAYLLFIAILRIKAHYGKFPENLDHHISQISGLFVVIVGYLSVYFASCYHTSLLQYGVAVVFAASQTKASIHFGNFGMLVDGMMLICAPIGVNLCQLIYKHGILVALSATAGITLGQLLIVPNTLHWRLEKMDRDREIVSRRSSVNSVISV